MAHKIATELAPLLSSEQVDALKAFVSPRKKVLCAVSGGCDSVVLLTLLCEMGYRSVVICHYNHRLRGRESGCDAAFVRRLARSYSCELEIGHATRDEIVHMKSAADGLEAAARRLRYAFFRGAASRQRTKYLFLGHHADDQAETVLWNLLRGSGLRGLGGMRRVSCSDRLTLLRPLLHVTRSQLEAFAQQRNIRFRQDASNFNPSLTRNRIRYRMIPWLEKELGRNVRDPIVRTAELLQDDEAWFEDLTTHLLPANSDPLPISSLHKLPRAGQRRLLRQWLALCQIPQIASQHIEAARLLMTTPPPYAKMNLPGGHHLRRRGGILFVEPRELA